MYSKGVKEQNFTKNETLVNSITLDSLRPNAQYIVYVTAANDKGESEASETLIAWTDPAHSPFVEVNLSLSSNAFSFPHSDKCHFSLDLFCTILMNNEICAYTFPQHCT